MIVSFTQTYGNDRTELLEIYTIDKRLIEFKNLFDINIYSFHNCDDSVIEKFKKLNKVKNTLILRFNNIDYTTIIYDLKQKLKDLGCTHLFFSQDDTFSDDNKDINWKELIEYVKSFQLEFMLNLTHTKKDLQRRVTHTNNIPNIYFDSSIDVDYDLHKSFTIYKSNTLDFKAAHMMAMTDDPFICTIDLLDEIYDSKYIDCKNIWDAEQYLIMKYSSPSRCINRYVTNKPLFKAYNLYGRTLMKNDEHRNQLIERNLLCRMN